MENQAVIGLQFKEEQSFMLSCKLLPTDTKSNEDMGLIDNMLPVLRLDALHMSIRNAIQYMSTTHLVCHMQVVAAAKVL